MKVLRIILLILVILLGTLAVKTEFGPYQIHIFSDYFKYFVLFLFLIIAMLSFLIERNNYLRKKKIKEFAVTIIAVVFSSLVVLRVAKRDIVEARSTLIRISSIEHAQNKMVFEFKTGNDFKLTVHNGGETDIYHGRYSKTNDTIKIRSSNYDESKELPEFGIIRNDTMLWNKFDTMLVDREVK